jgi:preprotein translocase, secG subunit
MFTFILAIHIIVAIALSGLILIQHGKGADAGASFGSGAAGTVFGASGSANFLTRTTAILAAIFFATSLALAYHAKEENKNQFHLDVKEAPKDPKAPISHK